MTRIEKEKEKKQEFVQFSMSKGGSLKKKLYNIFTKCQRDSCLPFEYSHWMVGTG